MNSNVTVVADETLGGVLREFKRVERDAEKGEKIEIIAIHPNSLKVGEVSVGEVFAVKYRDTSGDVYDVYERSFRGIVSNNWDGLREYVVLEPTDVVQIDGLRYSMVDRKASVGERVIVTKTDVTKTSGCNVRHNVGDIGTVKERNGTPTRPSDRVQINEWYILDGDYAVLTPVIEIPSVVHAEDSPHSLRKDLDNLESGVAEDIAELRERISALEAVVFAGKVLTEPPVVSKTPQQIRDEVVERAKDDVKKISKDIYGDSDNDAFERYGIPGHIKVIFKVNRKKRTVVALLGLRHCGNHIYERGIAKTAPNDVSNAHIGKAIALRRALGLEVPAEYLNVPNPTEFRVGDVVNGNESGYYSAEKRFTITKIDGNQLFYAEDADDWIYRRQIGKILDDTREGAEQPASSTKGASAA